MHKQFGYGKINEIMGLYAPVRFFRSLIHSLVLGEESTAKIPPLKRRKEKIQ